MRERALGTTGTTVPEVVFGAGAVGGGVFRGTPEERRAIVARALELGITWFDTAPSYGEGASEENLGAILEALGATPRISTKVRLAPGDLADIPGAVDRSLRASLARLRRPRVDLVQLHNPVGPERDERRGQVAITDVLGAGGVADALDRARDEGLTRLTGFTALGDVEALHQVVAAGRFRCAQVYHNILNPSATRAMPPGFDALDYRELAVEAERRGMGVLNIRVLAAGVVAGGEGRGRAMSPGSAPEDDARRSRALSAALAGEPGTMAQRAIRFALGQPGISGMLVGFTTIAQVEEAVAAAALPPLSEPALAALERLYASGFAGAA